MLHRHFSLHSPAESRATASFDLVSSPSLIRVLLMSCCMSGSSSMTAALEAELLADQKEIAEHLMLIDLGRNDVAKAPAHAPSSLAGQR